MSSITQEQYLALSQSSYSSTLPLEKLQANGQPWTIDALIKNQKIPGISYNKITSQYTITDPACANLLTMLSWKLIAFQPNTASGFSGAAFQAPDGPNGEPGEIVFAFRGTEKDEIQKRNGVLPEDILQKLLENVKHGISSTYSMFSSYCYSYTLSVQ